MYEYRQIIYRLQQGETIRAIARAGFAKRQKITSIKNVAEKNGWLSKDALLPDEKNLSTIFNTKNIVHVSKIAPYAEVVKTWVNQGVQSTVIYRHLKDVYGFEGAYSAVLRFVRTLKEKGIKCTVPLHFQVGEAAQVDFGQGPVLYDERTKK